MPIYEYSCSSCGLQKEFLQKISDAPLTDCPECKQPTLGKLLSAAGFQLKGSGWYATDFRGGGSSSTTSAPAKTESSGSDSAPAAPAACGTSCASH